MLEREMAHGAFGPVEDRFVSPTSGGRGLTLLFAAREEARAALVRAQEEAAIEAQDVMSQADEALVMG